MTCLPTRNTDWGFTGTAARNGYAIDAGHAWAGASEGLAAAFGWPAADVRDYLDSRHGRHLADDLSFMREAMTAETIADHVVGRAVAWRREFEQEIAGVRRQSGIVQLALAA